MMLQRALVILFLGLTNTLVVGKIVFNEIMIDSNNAKFASTQWFELYNTEDTTIPLDEWTFRACIDNVCTSRDLSTSKSIGPFGYFVIGNNANLFLNGGVQVDYQVLALPVLPKDGSGSVALVFFKAGTPASTVHWSTDNPSGLYKNLPFTPGTSLARINPLGSSWDVDNWSPSTTLINCANGSDKGTPGKINDYLCPPTLAPVMTPSPSKAPTKPPTKSPTKSPLQSPTKSPAKSPTKSPTKSPAKSPTKSPTKSPAKSPTKSPTKAPSEEATKSSCGLFGLSILCLNGCGMFGRLFGACDA